MTIPRHRSYAYSPVLVDELLYNRKKLPYYVAMTRNLTVEAVVLAHRKTAGMHRRAVLLSPVIGLIEADAYGAKRGSLTGKINQFISGSCVLYHNPVKNSWKIEDFSPRCYRTFITSSLALVYTASFFSECIMKSFAGGGEHEKLYQITVSALDGLCDPEKRELVVIQFLWRYLVISGFLGEPGICSSCGAEVRGEGMLYLDSRGPSLSCGACLEDPRHTVKLVPGARAYLRHTLDKPFSEALKVSLHRDRAVELKNLLVSMADLITEGNLNTIGSNMV